MRTVTGRPCAAATHEKDLAVIEGLLEEIHAEIQTEPERRAHLKQLQDELAQLEETRKLQESALEDQRRLKTALAEQQQFLDVLGGQLATARQRLEQNSAALQEREAEAAHMRDQLQRADEITAAYQQWLGGARISGGVGKDCR